MKLYAFRGEMPSNNKIALGPLLFDVGEDFVLTPQPTQQQVAEYGLLSFLKTVEVQEGPVTAPEPPSEAVPEPFTGKLEVPKTEPNIIASLISDEDFEDDEDEPATPPTVDKPTSVDVKSMTLAQLRALCEERGIAYEASATKAKLITLIMKA